MKTKRLPKELKSDRFAARLYRGISFQNSCWLLTESLDDDGYAHIKLAGQRLLAHRASYYLHNGDIPDGMLVCHKCDVRNCINPRHLFLGTVRDNTVDASNKGRLATGDRNGLHQYRSQVKRGELPPQQSVGSPGEHNGSAVLTEQEVLLIRKQHHLQIETYGTLAKKFCVTKGCIAAVVKRRTWSHVPSATSLNVCNT